MEILCIVREKIYIYLLHELALIFSVCFHSVKW